MTSSRNGTTVAEVRNRKRDIDALDLSDEARADVKRLRAIDRSMKRHQKAIDEMMIERRDIWVRRNDAGDVWQAELARLSDVTSPYVAREILDK